MRVVYLGRKPTAAEGLRQLIELGFDIAVVVAPANEKSNHWKDRLIDVAENNNIPTATDLDLYRYLDSGNKKKFPFSLEDIDLVLSVLFWKRLKAPLIKLPKIGCINFHSAPLPDYRGFSPYSFAIYDERTTWGTSAHFVDEDFDTGDIIKTNSFPIDPDRETAFSLEQKSQRYLLELFNNVIEELLAQGKLPRTPQGKGTTRTREDFEKLRIIHPEDTIADVDKKVRAFWYPPYSGAAVMIKNKEYTVINEKILEELGQKYHA